MNVALAGLGGDCYNEVRWMRQVASVRLLTRTRDNPPEKSQCDAGQAMCWD